MVPGCQTCMCKRGIRDWIYLPQLNSNEKARRSKIRHSNIHLPRFHAPCSVLAFYVFTT